MQTFYLLFAGVFLVQGQHQQETQDDPQAWNEALGDAEEGAENEVTPGPDKQQSYMMCSFRGGTCRSTRCMRWEKKIGNCIPWKVCCANRIWKEVLG